MMLTLLYHGIFERDPYVSFPGLSGITGVEFERQIIWLKRIFAIVPLNNNEARRRPQLALTFDDGYANFMTVAYPILRRHQVPATIFVSTAFIDGGDLWFSRIEAACLFGPTADLQVLGARYPRGTPRARVQSRAALLQALGHLPWAEVKDWCEQLPAVAVSAGDERYRRVYAGIRSEDLRLLARDNQVAIGSHTINHPVLTTCDAEQVDKELVDSRRQLEWLTEHAVTFFSYPVGRYNAQVLSRTASVYDSAWAVDPMYLGTASHERPRTGIYRGSLGYLGAKLLGFTRPLRSQRAEEVSS